MAEGGLLGGLLGAFVGGRGDPHTPLADVVAELLAIRAARASSPLPSEPTSPPSVDLGPLPPISPGPVSPELPILTGGSFPSYAAPTVQALLAHQGHSSRESEALRRREAETYGRLRLGKARRMARRRRTMRVQDDSIPPVTFRNGVPTVNPQHLPVPYGTVPTQQDYERAMTDEGVRRAAQEREAARRQQPAPSRRSRRGGRYGVGVGVDAGGLLDRLGTVLGEGIGAIVGGPAEVDPEIEAEAQRAAEAARGRVSSEGLEEIRVDAAKLPGGRPPSALDRERVRQGRVRQMPPFDPQAIATMPPAPKRQRGARALHTIQRVTSNPWAQLGIFGLGLLGGRSTSRPRPALTAVPELAPPDDLTGFNTGLLPFVGGTPINPVSRSDTACSCKPKRKGPKRRCLERAQVAWRSGRYKGKLAGTRCVRWE